MLDSIERGEAAEKRRDKFLGSLPLLIAPAFLIVVGIWLVSARGTGLPPGNLWAGALACWAGAGIWLVGFIRANWARWSC